MTFLGYKKNSRAFIDQFDLLICSSKSEGGPPIVLMEAFSSNTLVLASNTREHKEAIIEGEQDFYLNLMTFLTSKKELLTSTKLKILIRLHPEPTNFIKIIFLSKNLSLEYEKIYEKLTNTNYRKILCFLIILSLLAYLFYLRQKSC